MKRTKFAHVLNSENIEFNSFRSLEISSRSSYRFGLFATSGCAVHLVVTELDCDA